MIQPQLLRAWRPLAAVVVLTPAAVFLLNTLYGQPPWDPVARLAAEPVFATYLLLKVAVPVFAVFARGRPERLFGAAYLTVAFLHALWLGMDSAVAVRHAGVTVNFGLLVVLVGISLRTGRTWAIIATAMQLIQFAIMAAAFVDTCITAMKVSIAAGIWDYILLAVFAYGAWRAHSDRVWLEELEPDVPGKAP